MKIIIELECTISKEEAEIMVDSFIEEPWVKKCYVEHDCSNCGKCDKTEKNNTNNLD